MSPISHAEAFALHNHEGFGGVEIGEYVGIDRVVEIARFLRARGALGAAVLVHFGGDLDAAGEALDDGDRGVFSSLADSDQALTEETVEIPEALRGDIDCEAMAQTRA